MRTRLTAALAVLALAGIGSTARPPEALAEKASCTDYCGEKAAENCTEIDSWRCSLYIAGCLAGCNVKKYL